MWYFSMLSIVCLHHCMYVCYMFIKDQSINQKVKGRTATKHAYVVGRVTTEFGTDSIDRLGASLFL